MSGTILGPVAGAAMRPATGAPSGSTDEERLRKSVHELEGLFVAQMLRVMRETVPEDGFVARGAGEEMFTAMLDEHLAEEVPSQWHHGIGEALYRQLRAAAIRPAEAGGDDARD